MIRIITMTTITAMLIVMVVVVNIALWSPQAVEGLGLGLGLHRRLSGVGLSRGRGRPTLSLLRTVWGLLPVMSQAASGRANGGRDKWHVVLLQYWEPPGTEGEPGEFLSRKGVGRVNDWTMTE